MVGAGRWGGRGAPPRGFGRPVYAKPGCGSHYGQSGRFGRTRGLWHPVIRNPCEVLQCSSSPPRPTRPSTLKLDDLPEGQSPGSVGRGVVDSARRFPRTAGQARGEASKTSPRSIGAPGRPENAEHGRSSASRPAADRDRVDRDLAEFFSEDMRRAYASNPHVAPAVRAPHRVRAPGRQAAAALGFAWPPIGSPPVGSTRPPRPVALAAASLEIFHAFMLVHDDLIDGSVTRARNRPTLHEAIRLGSGRDDHARWAGRAQTVARPRPDRRRPAVVPSGMRLLEPVGARRRRARPRPTGSIADMLFETGLGEALDVLYDDCPLEHLSEETTGRVVPPQDRPVQRLGPAGAGGDHRRRPGPGRPWRRSNGSATFSGSASRSRTTSTPSTKTPSTATTPTSMAASEPMSCRAAYQGLGERRAVVALAEALGLPGGAGSAAQAPPT